jgi:hypothetical protein
LRPTVLAASCERWSQFHDHRAEHHASHAGSACSTRAYVSTIPHALGLYTHARKVSLFSRNVSTAAEPLPGCEEPPWFRMLVDWLKVMTIDPTQAAQDEYIDLL